MLPTSFYGIWITLTPKADKGSAVRENYRPIFLRNTDVYWKPSTVWITIIHFPFFYPMPPLKEMQVIHFFWNSAQGGRLASSHMPTQWVLGCPSSSATAGLHWDGQTCHSMLTVRPGEWYMYYSIIPHFSCLFHQSYFVSHCKTFKSMQDTN